MGVERAVQYLLVDEQPLDEIVLGLEVEVVGEQRRDGRRTDDYVRVDQVAPDVHRLVEHQLQRQVDLASGPVVEQHPASVGGQHDGLVRRRGGVRVAGPLVDDRHDGAPVAGLSQRLETLDERQQRQPAHHVAPQQHEVVSDERTRVQVPEHVAERSAGVRSGVDDVQPPGTGRALHGRLDPVRAPAGAEHDDVHDARRLEHVERVVYQRPVDERYQARAVPVGRRPEVLVEEVGHHHGLQHVLLLHLVGAHGEPSALRLPLRVNNLGKKVDKAETCPSASTSDSLIAAYLFTLDYSIH